MKLYTIEEVYAMYDKNKKNIYDNEVEKYLIRNLKLFQDNKDSQELMKKDAEDMRRVLNELHCGDIQGAVEATFVLDTFVRENLVHILIENKS